MLSKITQPKTQDNNKISIVILMYKKQIETNRFHGLKHGLDGVFEAECNDTNCS